MRSTTALILLAALPLTSAEIAGLSEERLARIGPAMRRQIEAKQITGAVTLVARRGKIAHFEAHGLMDLETNKPMAKDSIFRIWSMSKPVAGVAILMLMEEGKVRLTDPVSNFIPEFRGMKVAIAQEGSPQGFYTIPATREITIQDLLTHVSGLGSGGPAAGEAKRIARKDGESLADYIPRLGTTPLAFQPGSRWTYSPGAAFDTLGRVVEVASGQTFDVFLRQRIFEPLGMKTTFFHPGEERMGRVVTAYHRTPEGFQKNQNPNMFMSKTYFSGGGGLSSTAEDYAQFAMMLAEGGQLNGKRLLSRKTVELMASVFVPDTMPGRSPGRGYGLSVQVVSDPVAAGLRMSKGSFGWDGAYGTHFWVDPVERLAGIMMVQTDNPNRQVDRDFENAVQQAIID